MKEHTILLPGEGQQVWCRARGLRNNLQVFVRPAISLPQGIVITPSCSKVVRHCVLVQICNTSESSILLKSNLRVAKLETFEEELPEIECVFLDEHESNVTQVNSVIVPAAASEAPPPVVVKSGDKTLPLDLKIDNDNLSTEEVAQFRELCLKYSDVFSQHENDVGKALAIIHWIILTDYTPL